MLNDIYNKRIIELAAISPPRPPPRPDASATAHSSCAADRKIDLKMDGPVVTDFGTT